MKGKRGVIMTIVVIVAIIIIFWVCDMVGKAFGPWGENAALGIVAIILAIGYFKARKESLAEKEKVDIENEQGDNGEMNPDKYSER